MPPMKPTLPVLLARLASSPARKEPSWSLNTTEATFGRSITVSMIANCCFGNSLATLVSALPWPKPTAITGFAPFCAMRRSACSRWVSLAISKSR